MKFELEIDWLSDTRLSYISTDETSRASYSFDLIDLVNGETTLSVSAHDILIEELIKYISKTHKIKQSDIKFHSNQHNGPWYWYGVTFDWGKHRKWAQPLIKAFKTSELDEILGEYTTAELQAVVKLRKSKRRNK